MAIVKNVFLAIFVFFYVSSGVNHFLTPDFYLKLMPPYIPYPLQIIYLSGVIEILLGVGAAIPRFRARAAWAVIFMLISFMPVHIHMVVHPELYPDVPEIGLWLRIVVQGVLIWWAYGYAKAISFGALLKSGGRA
jgi:uncharacterized membrane protein